MSISYHGNKAALLFILKSIFSQEKNNNIEILKGKGKALTWNYLLLFFKQVLDVLFPIFNESIKMWKFWPIECALLT